MDSSDTDYTVASAGILNPMYLSSCMIALGATMIVVGIHQMYSLTIARQYGNSSANLCHYSIQAPDIDGLTENHVKRTKA